MKKIFQMTLAVTVLVAASASAAVGGNPAHLSFAQLREACANPERFHNQAAPQNLEISCQDVQYRYIPHASQNVALNVSRFVTSSLISDKYSVSPSTQEIATTEELVACPQYKKVKDVLSLNRAVTCDEILNFKGEAAEFCMGLLDDMRNSNPAAIQTVETNEIFSACDSAPSVDTRGQRGQRGQRSQRGQRDEINDRGQRGQREVDDRSQRGQSGD